MSTWPSTRARLVLIARERIGWTVKQKTGSHRTFERLGWADVVFAFHDRDEIGPRILSLSLDQFFHGYLDVVRNFPEQGW